MAVNGPRTTLLAPTKRYEINPHARTQDCASEQAFPVVKGDDQIRTGESDQRIDCPPFNPDGRRNVWLLISLYVLLLAANLMHQGGVG